MVEDLRGKESCPGVIPGGVDEFPDQILGAFHIVIQKEQEIGAVSGALLHFAKIVKDNTPYPITQLDYTGNVLNQKAATFYRRHGVTSISPAAESGLDMRSKQVMRTRYCLKHQLGLCPKDGNRSAYEEPLYLVDEDGRRYELRFNCAACEMAIYFHGRTD